MLTHLYSGKVRELYQADGGVILLVASDRISAGDYLLQPAIPDKGKILTQLSLWWFERLADVVPNHLVDVPIPAEFDTMIHSWDMAFKGLATRLARLRLRPPR